MNAHEARRKATIVKTKEIDSQYADIKHRIDLAVADGKYETYFYESLIKDVKLKLQVEGYKVCDYSGGMNETNTTISW